MATPNMPRIPIHAPQSAERFIMGELIREQILLMTREEVPHSVAVEIEKVVEEPNLTRVFRRRFPWRTLSILLDRDRGATLLCTEYTLARIRVHDSYVTGDCFNVTRPRRMFS